MPISKSPLANIDAKEAMERAISSPHGVRVTFETRGKAVQFRQRCYTYRAADRERNNRTFGSEDERGLTSAFDELTIDLDGCIAVIRKTSLGKLKIEEIEV